MGMTPTDIDLAATPVDPHRPAGLIADENFSLALVKDLRGHGCSVLTAQEAGLVKKPDGHNWAWARRRGRILLTHDHDFVEEWRFPVKDGPGLAYLPQLMGAEAKLHAVRVLAGFARHGDPLMGIKLLFQTDGGLILRTHGVNGSPVESPVGFEGSARDVTRQIAAFMSGAV
jgi:hypothetical protein